MDSAWITLAFNVLIIGALAVAGVFIWKRTQSKELAGLQEKIIEALKETLEEKDNKIAALEQRVELLDETLATVRVALRKQGITIRINGEYVTLIYADKPRQITTKITKVAVRALAAQDDAASGKEGVQVKQPVKRSAKPTVKLPAS